MVVSGWWHQDGGIRLVASRWWYPAGGTRLVASEGARGHGLHSRTHPAWRCV